MKRHLWSALALTLTLLSSAMARGQPIEQARDVEARARAAYQQRDFEAAARAFAEAHRLVPNALTRYNEAQSWYRAAKRARAADAYEDALRLGTLDVALSDKSRKRLRELEKRVGVLVVPSPEGARVTVAHVDDRSVPARIHLDPGAHAITVRTHAGKAFRRNVHIAVGQTAHLALPVEPEESPATSPPRDGAQRGDDAAPNGSSDGPSSNGEGQRIGGWVLIGLGGAGGIAAIALGASTLRAIDDFKDGGNTDAELRAEAVRLRTWTNIMAAAAVASGGIGLILVLTASSADASSGSGSEPRRVTAASFGVVVSPAPVGGGLRLSW